MKTPELRHDKPTGTGKGKKPFDLYKKIVLNYVAEKTLCANQITQESTAPKGKSFQQKPGKFSNK